MRYLKSTDKNAIMYGELMPLCIRGTERDVVYFEEGAAQCVEVTKEDEAVQEFTIVLCDGREVTAYLTPAADPHSLIRFMETI